jgi:hypothetical protein
MMLPKWLITFRGPQCFNLLAKFLPFKTELQAEDVGTEKMLYCKTAGQPVGLGIVTQ